MRNFRSDFFCRGNDFAVQIKNGNAVEPIDFATSCFSHSGSQERPKDATDACRLSTSKRRAVLKLLAGSEVDLPVYIGDDTTDEDVFKVLKGRGVGIRVGPPQTPTAADGFLPDCEAVRELLKTWLLMA